MPVDYAIECPSKYGTKLDESGKPIVLSNEDKLEEANMYLVQVIVKLLLITQSFVKIMFFVRIFKKMGFMVRMVGSTIIDIIPFLIFICMFILYFALISRLTEVDWDPNPSNRTYPDLS